MNVEARTAAQRSHPGVFADHGVAQGDQRIFVVQEYVEGQDLPTLAIMRAAPSAMISLGNAPASCPQWVLHVKQWPNRSRRRTGKPSGLQTAFRAISPYLLKLDVRQRCRGGFEFHENNQTMLEPIVHCFFGDLLRGPVWKAI